MQEERSVADGAEEQKPSGPFTCGENEDSSGTRGELRNRVAEIARQVGISTSGTLSI